MIQKMPCFSHHGSMHVYPTYTHTYTPLLYYQLFVPYHWYTEIEAYSNSIYLVRALLALSCYTKRFITCYQMLSIYIDASNNILCATHYPRSTGIHIYLHISIEQVIVVNI